MKDDNIYKRFSREFVIVLVNAKSASYNAGVDKLYVESLLIGMIGTNENPVNQILLEHGVDLDKLLKKFKRRLQSKKKNDENFSYDEINVHEETVKSCERANELSLENHCTNVELGHVFAAIMEINQDIKRIVSKECNDYAGCIKKMVSQNVEVSFEKEVTRSVAKQTDSIIEQFCTNMIEEANSGKLDPILAREDEIEEAITILCRRKKSNPILVGEPGVGKTAIVEGIAQRIASGTVPKKLLGSKLYCLNLAGLVAGTKFRGDFEKRIQDLITAIEEDDDCIIFIDEIHTIVGAGGVGGAMDAANILKPALARSLRCIGATTNQEYKKYFAEDGALARRFGKVMVEEPSKEDTKKILLGIKEKYENHHECSISNDAIDSIIELTDRYLHDKQFPDKAIDCMDTAGAMIQMQEDHLPVIKSCDIAKVVSKQCNIALEVIMWDKHERIQKVEEYLKNKVVGQEAAVESACRAIKNANSGVRDVNKPLAVLCFGGPSGTGKTYLAKQMSKALYDNDNSFIRLDMSEFSEEHSVSKVTGAPPGYIGHDKTSGLLVEKIKNRPYSIVLLDEIEKAHPKVLRVFLQVMSDGFITSSDGKKIDCRHVYFIMTGNFGMNTSQSAQIGFSKEDKESNEKKRLIQFLNKTYGQEFTNRIDDVIPFFPLTDDELKRIIELRLSEFPETISNKQVKVSFGKNLVNTIFKESKESHGMNATVVNRVINKTIRSLVSDAIFEITDFDKHDYTLTVNSNKDDVISVKKRTRKKK